MTLRNLPNALSLFRIAMVPVLGVLAWTGQESIFLGALLLSLGSDVADGYVARKSGVTSETGAKLDSWGDLATYATLPLFAWWLWPEMLRAEVHYLACALFAYTLPIAVGLLRFGRLTSYHTWAAKGTAVLMGVALFVLFAGGPSWPFHVATFLLVVEAMEEIAISCVLPRWKSDVRSLRHAIIANQNASNAMNARVHSPPWSSARSSGSSFALTVRRSRPSRRAASS